MRKLTSDERRVIQELALRLPTEKRNQLLTDMERATAESVPGNSARILFTIAGYERPSYRGQHPFHVEGTVQDRDGNELSVLLHADENGRLLELEIVRFDKGGIIEPDWNTLRFE